MAASQELSFHGNGRHPLHVEEKLPYFKMYGYCQLCEEYEDTPTDIISTHESWSVKLHWKTKGPLNCLMCGKWEIGVYLEKLGKGEYMLDKEVYYADFYSKPYDYWKEIKFKPYSVPEGVYILVVTLKLLGPHGVPGPVVGYCKAGCVQFYDSKNFDKKKPHHIALTEEVTSE